jgi:predicted neutral ceramidase superfamily lipid hydrolase
MKNRWSSLSYKRRSLVAFLLVPWLPLLIFVPYVGESRSFRIFGWDHFGSHVGLCLVLAVFTYLLEVFVLSPILFVMLEGRRTSFLSIVAAGTFVAFIVGILLLSFISGQDFLFRNDLRGLLLLICLVGFTEAAVFWLIARPDKFQLALNSENSTTQEIGSE